MVFRKSGHGLGYKEYAYGYQLKGKKHLIVGGDDSERIGKVEEWEISEIQDSITVSFEEIYSVLHPLYQELFVHMRQKEIRDQEDAYLNDSFYIEDSLPARKLLKYVFKLKRYYETGCLLHVRCNSERKASIFQMCRHEGVKVGETITNIE